MYVTKSNSHLNMPPIRILCCFCKTPLELKTTVGVLVGRWVLVERSSPEQWTKYLHLTIQPTINKDICCCYCPLLVDTQQRSLSGCLPCPTLPASHFLYLLLSISLSMPLETCNRLNEHLVRCMWVTICATAYLCAVTAAGFLHKKECSAWHSSIDPL